MSIAANNQSFRRILFARHPRRKIVLPVRFAEVKEEVAKPINRRKTTFNAAGGHVAKRTDSAILTEHKRWKNL
jgi:hypothetical protein